MQHGIEVPHGRQIEVCPGHIASFKALKSREGEVVFKILFNPDSGDSKDA